MNYFLYKWRFTTPVHFGKSDSALSLYGSNMNICADTLFSALCHTALEMGGSERLNQLVEDAKQDRLVISDTFPWKGEEVYLPKPLYRSEKKSKQTDPPAGIRKAMKKLNWIPVSSMTEYVHSLETDTPFPVADIDQDFGTLLLNEKAAVRTGGDARPYQVGTYYFNKDAGLYFIAATASEEIGDRLEKLQEELGLGGIGGKRTTGLGKFEVDDTILLDEPFDDDTVFLKNALNDRASKQLLLTTSLPKKNETDLALQDASYLLIRRGGFVQSEHFAKEMRKKKVQYYLKAGSVLRHSYKGDLYQVGSPDGRHPVYRYSKPIFLGVNL